jgi:hypothetical protein
VIALLFARLIARLIALFHTALLRLNHKERLL